MQPVGKEEAGDAAASAGWNAVLDDLQLRRHGTHYSYVFTKEYEIGEFNLANTYNYAEMVSLIAPRPFMAERGHNDAVGMDEWVAYEFAKVRRFYASPGIPDRTAIEFFQGPHTIHAAGTFEFLDQHLRP